MSKFLCLFVIISSVNVIIGYKMSDINVILRVCDVKTASSNCYVEKNYTGKAYFRKALRLLSSGISQELFSSLDSHIGDTSTSCSVSLKSIRNGILNGNEKDFKIVDASAKIPPAFLDLTVTSLGDFDECLSLKETSWKGKYCLVDVFPLLPRDDDSHGGLLQLGKYTFFNGTPNFFGLCFPSTCNENDVRHVVSSVLEDHPFKVSGDISCVTQDDINILSRLRLSSTGQRVAIAFLGIFVFCVGVASFLDIVCRLIYRYLDFKINISFIDTFSALTNGLELIEKRTSDSRMVFVDWVKVGIVMAGIFAHCTSCLETPLGFFMTSHHYLFTIVFTNPLTQFFFNDGGLGCITFLSGLSIYLTLSPLIQSNRLSYPKAIFDRWIRFAPAVLVITACDILWPMVISGPFASRVGSWIFNKCSSNWLHNFFLMSVFLPALNICAPHTYYSSIDFLLYIIGLPIIYLLVHRPHQGRMACYSLAMVGILLTLYYTYIYETPPAVMFDHAPAQKIVNFLDTMQMSLYSYFHNFFLGLWTAHNIKHGFKLDLSTYFKHFKWLFLMWLSFMLAEMSPALHNTFDVIPASMVPFFLVLNRLCFTVSIILLILYTSSLAAQQEKSQSVNAESSAKCVREETPSDDTDGISRLKSLFSAFLDAFGSPAATLVTRLSFSLFISNYLFIRSDFFSSRYLLENNFYPLFKRMTSMFANIFLTAFVFHLLFIAPLDKLRRKLNYSIKKVEKKIN